MSRPAGALRAAACAGVLGLALTTPALAATGGSGPVERPYPGDAGAEAALVQAEEQRLLDTRATMSATGLSGTAGSAPYRIVGGRHPTLVLVARPAPYTLTDLAGLAPQSLTRQPDGAFLFTEDVVVDTGATLDLSADQGARVRLESTAGHFVSIVATGGSLRVRGGSRPVDVSSWAPETGRADSDTADGRAYIRMIGGRLDLHAASFHDLGFWSGMTGGVSLTGTRDRAAGDGTPPGTTRIEPTSPLPPGTPQDVPLPTAPQSVSAASIDRSTFARNAFGLFLTGVEGVRISDSTLSDNLADGLVLHRGVADAQVERTTARGNAADGFLVTRASSGVVLDRVTASGNARNGITVEGGSLAEGPNATGLSPDPTGKNRVTGSTVDGNGHNGIQLIGGRSLTVDGNRVSGGESGIVADDGATGVTIRDNRVSRASEHGIALRDGITRATASGNTVAGGRNGLYLRAGQATLRDNTVTGTTRHGVALVGDVHGTVVSDNTLSGTGPSALDDKRSTGAVVADNAAEDWSTGTPLDLVLGALTRPMSVLWIALAVLLAVSAATGIRWRGRRTIESPYAQHASLRSFSMGVVDRDTALRLRGTPSPAAPGHAAPGGTAPGAPTGAGGDRP